ncbi:MAG: DUF86 domain-containing protein [Methanosarcinales archaeon]|nr:DUF86 domain-containing protein [Methanosarcinales archaeon]
MTAERLISDYLDDIIDTIDKVELFIEDMDFEQFAEDDKTVFAVIRAFEIIGEATKNIPQSIKDKYPSVPWKEMAGIRDKLIHGYFGVKLAVVWETTQQDLPSLKPLIAQIIKENIEDE